MNFEGLRPLVLPIREERVVTLQGTRKASTIFRRITHAPAISMSEHLHGMFVNHILTCDSINDIIHQLTR